VPPRRRNRGEEGKKLLMSLRPVFRNEEFCPKLGQNMSTILLVLPKLWGYSKRETVFDTMVADINVPSTQKT